VPDAHPLLGGLGGLIGLAAWALLAAWAWRGRVALPQPSLGRQAGLA
jgi:hypothetical protein